MSNWKKGMMVRVPFNAYNKSEDKFYSRYRHGMITQLRMQTGIAYIQFLPIEETPDQWVQFDIMEHT